MALRLALEHFVPEPELFMTGCQPWPPRVDGAPFHVDPDKPLPTGPCPVCKGKICNAATGVFCGWENKGNTAYERRCLRALAADGSRERCRDDADKAARKEAALEAKIRRNKDKLSERLKRRTWNGNKGGLLAERQVGDNDFSKSANLARAGREFLIRLGQLPDWDLILDARGRIIGRYSEQVGPEADQDGDAAD